MRKTQFTFSLFIVFFMILGCKEKSKEPSEKRIVFDNIPTLNADSSINILVEIPAGTTAKFELDKLNHTLKIDSVDGQPRYIDYLGYPGNYGMIPNTLLNKNQGGDGDPLDILLLGAAVNRGEIVQAKLIGVLKLKDNGEQDHKLIAVPNIGWNANNLETLDENYPGVLNIIQTFFLNYKGDEEMVFVGWGEQNEAFDILKSAQLK